MGNVVSFDGSLSSLPVELIREIALLLPTLKDVLNLGLVNKALYSVFLFLMRKQKILVDEIHYDFFTRECDQFDEIKSFLERGNYFVRNVVEKANNSFEVSLLLDYRRFYIALIRNPSIVEKKDANGDMLLHCMARRICAEETIEVEKERQSNNTMLLKALHCVSKRRYVLNFNAKNNVGDTPLHILARMYYKSQDYKNFLNFFYLAYQQGIIFNTNNLSETFLSLLFSKAYRAYEIENKIQSLIAVIKLIKENVDFFRDYISPDADFYKFQYNSGFIFHNTFQEILVYNNKYYALANILFQHNDLLIKYITQLRKYSQQENVKDILSKEIDLLSSFFKALAEKIKNQDNCTVYAFIVTNSFMHYENTIRFFYSLCVDDGSDIVLLKKHIKEMKNLFSPYKENPYACGVSFDRDYFGIGCFLIGLASLFEKLDSALFPDYISHISDSFYSFFRLGPMPSQLLPCPTQMTVTQNSIFSFVPQKSTQLLGDGVMVTNLEINRQPAF